MVVIDLVSFWGIWGVYYDAAFCPSLSLVKMAASGAVCEITAPTLLMEKSCKKCKKKVQSAFIKCVDCDIVYHKSCFDQIAQRTRNNCEMISDCEIKCDAHPLSPVPEDVNYLKKLTLDLKRENLGLKNEINKLNEEVKRLHKMRDTPNDISIVTKTLSDKLKEEVTDLFTNMEQKLNATIRKELDEIKSTRGSLTAQEKQKTYSDVVKRDNILIIKPKNEQSSDETWEQLRGSVQPEQINIGITHVKKLKNGSVLIGCQEKDDLNKLQQATNHELVENYDVIKPRERRPKVKIVDIANNYDEENLKKNIANQNPTLSEYVKNWKVIVTKKMKKNYMTICEIDSESFHELRRLQKMYINWSSCRVFEYFDVHRCFQCGGFNHNSNKCTEPKLCLKCGESNHCENDCNNSVSCINCTRANSKFNLDLKTDHTRFDSEKCDLLKKQINILRKKTTYNT